MISRSKYLDDYSGGSSAFLPSPQSIRAITGRLQALLRRGDRHRNRNRLKTCVSANRACFVIFLFVPASAIQNVENSQLWTHFDLACRDVRWHVFEPEGQNTSLRCQMFWTGGSVLTRYSGLRTFTTLELVSMHTWTQRASMTSICCHEELVASVTRFRGDQHRRGRQGLTLGRSQREQSQLRRH